MVVAIPTAVGRLAWLSVGVVAAGIACSADAAAMGALVSTPAGSATATEVHVAFAGKGTPGARWASLRVQGSATTFAWILPVRDGAYVDFTSDAWLESLESATAPRLVPPDPTPPCELSPEPELDGDPAHHATTAPDAAELAADRPGLDLLLASHGLALTSDLEPGIDAAAAAGSRFLVLVFTSGAGDLRTRAVRVVDDAEPAVSLSLLRGGTMGTSVTAYAVAAGATRFGTGNELVLDPAVVLWGAGGTSTYGSATQALLFANPGGWLADTIARDSLFASVPVPDGAPVQALDETYFFRAASYGDATDAPGACANAAAAASASSWTVAQACPMGAVARVNVAAGCGETPNGDQIDPSAFRCGGASDDLAIALAGLTPGQAWVTRARSFLVPDLPGVDSLVGDDPTASARGPVIAASGYEMTCTQPGTGGGSGGGSGGQGSSSPPNGGNGNGSGTGNDLGSAVAGGAAGAAGGCAGDSSSGDGCGGDTSSDGSDSSSSGCGSDTSSSSDSSSSGCSGDSSGSDSGSSGCGGDSSAGSSDCSTAARHGGRSRAPASRVLVLLAAVIAVARRARRKRSNVSDTEAPQSIPSPGGAPSLPPGR